MQNESMRNAASCIFQLTKTAKMEALLNETCIDETDKSELMISVFHFFFFLFRQQTVVV